MAPQMSLEETPSFRLFLDVHKEVSWRNPHPSSREDSAVSLLWPGFNPRSGNEDLACHSEQPKYK